MDPFERELTRLPTMEEDLPVARNPGTDPRIPQIGQMQAELETVVGMSDQEIRARALECACRLFSGCMKDPESAAAFDGCKAEFEDYIRNGK